jgi:hypothetical protein
MIIYRSKKRNLNEVYDKKIFDHELYNNKEIKLWTHLYCMYERYCNISINDNILYLTNDYGYDGEEIYIESPYLDQCLQLSTLIYIVYNYYELRQYFIDGLKVFGYNSIEELIYIALKGLLYDHDVNDMCYRIGKYKKNGFYNHDTYLYNITNPIFLNKNISVDSTCYDENNEDEYIFNIFYKNHIKNTYLVEYIFYKHMYKKEYFINFMNFIKYKGLVDQLLTNLKKNDKSCTYINKIMECITI